MSNTSRSLFVREAGVFRQATSQELMLAARAAMARRFQAHRTLASPAATAEYLTATLGHLEHEVFGVVHLDNRMKWLAYSELFRGTIDGASVHPREVVKDVLRQNSATVILAHCHPSGNPEPSQADELITRRLRDALALIDVRVVDHVIIAGTLSYSFASHGLL